MSIIADYYEDLIYNSRDPRTRNWFLCGRPYPILAIVAFYIYFSTSLGPRIMRNREPFTLRNTLIVYNFVQVLLSIYLVYEGLVSGWLYDYSFTCQPVDYSTEPKVMRAVNAAYFFYMLKVIELLDTVFFVMRKKQRQISFLHVYHHSLMPICGWIGLGYAANGHGTLMGLINTFIHVFMYTYYMLAAFGPKMQKYLWWKKYITTMQLVQFCIIFVHNVQVFFNGCNFSRVLAFLLCLNASLFIYLFGKFYVKTYMKTNKSSNGYVKNDKKID